MATGTPITIVDVELTGNNKHITIQPRVLSQGSLLDGIRRIYFDITPNASPNTLTIGARGLVR